jgi:hypothetical protein
MRFLLCALGYLVFPCPHHFPLLALDLTCVLRFVADAHRNMATHPLQNEPEATQHYLALTTSLHD